MFQTWIEHARNCRAVRHLLREHARANFRQIYWYDLPLEQAVRWRGILRVFWWNLTRRRDDEIAGNYDLVNLYWAPPPGDGKASSAATVWRCTALESKPWHDEANAARATLEAQAGVIAAEYRAVARQLVTHPDNASLTDRGRWTGMFLYGVQGMRNEELARLCPATTRVVDSLPLCRNFGFVMFSGMEPHTHVAAHSGSSNLRLRVHLGVDVPEPDKGRLRVGTEWRTWQEGRTFAFDDSFEHEVVHEGDQARVVLVVDLWHPDLTPEDIALLSDPVFQRFGKVGRKKAVPD